MSQYKVMHINTHYNIFQPLSTHPLVEILQNTLDTSQNTRSDTDQYPVLVIPRRVRQSPRGLNQRHQQTAEAYTPERRGERSAERAEDRTASRGLGGEPPGSDGAGDRGVECVLYDLVGEEVG